MHKNTPFSLAPLVMLGVSLGVALPAAAGQGRHPPPDEAVVACSGLAASEACAFETPHGHQVAGSCQQLRDEITACVPSSHPRKRHGAKASEMEVPS